MLRSTLLRGLRLYKGDKFIMKATKKLWSAFGFIISLFIMGGILFNPKILPYTIILLIIIVLIIFGIYKFSGKLFNETFDKTKEFMDSKNDSNNTSMRAQYRRDHKK